MQTIKKLFVRYDGDNTNYYLQSPAELLFNRQLKTTLPAIIKPLHNSEAVRASFIPSHSKKKPDLLPTKAIWVQDTVSKRWNPGVVKAQADTLLLHHPDTTRQMLEKPLTSEKRLQYQPQFKSQKIQPTILRFHYSQYKGMCILRPSALSRNLPSLRMANPLLSWQGPPGGMFKILYFMEEIHSITILSMGSSCCAATQSVT